MIEINLLPEELKNNDEKTVFAIKYFLYIIVLLFGIIIFLHFYLVIVSIAKNYQFGALNRKWQSLEPERKKLENFNKGYRLSVDDAKVMQQLIIQKLNWSEKLNKLSLDLPSGVWFNELSLRGKNFVLKGSALSLQKEEVSLINQFMDNLKKDTNFFKDFISLELSSVQRRVIAGYDVIDFILTGALK